MDAPIPLEVEGYPTLIHAIVGRGFLSMTEAEMLEREGFARYSGTSQLPEWEWDRRILERLPHATLLEILTRTA
jgi:hypothetical protein